jgi:hypothetical protein
MSVCGNYVSIVLEMCVCHMRRRIHVSLWQLCLNSPRNVCVSYEEEDTCQFVATMSQ